MKGEHILDKDIISKVYMSDKERLADIVNVVFYNGKAVIKPKHIIEMDTVINRVWKRLGWIKTTVFYRDIFRKVQVQGYDFLLGIELQTGIDYTMPLRVMNYDLQGYEKILKTLRKHHKITKDLNKTEYISGISNADRLQCIVTIVIYFGEKEWDGPRDLHGMLALKGLPAEVVCFIPNYPVYILDIRRIKNIDYFKTDLKFLIELLQCALDKQKLRDFIRSKSRDTLCLQEDSYDMICLLTDTPDLLELKEKYREKGGVINMCKAWDELLAETRAEGVQLATAVIRLSIQGLDERKIADKCGVSLEEVRHILEDIAA